MYYYNQGEVITIFPFFHMVELGEQKKNPAKCSILNYSLVEQSTLFENFPHPLLKFKHTH